MSKAYKAFQHDSLKKSVDRILAMHATVSSAEIVKFGFSELYNIVQGFAVSPATDDFWRTVGYPAIASAYAEAAGLARFREALESPLFSYVTSGHSVSPNSYHIYFKDSTSPTGRIHAASASKTGYAGEMAAKMMAEKNKTTRLSGSYTHDYRG